MTAQQAKTIRTIEAQHEAERFIASQSSRDVGELDPRAVLVAIEVKLAEGRIEEARALAAEYRASKKASA